MKISKFFKVVASFTALAPLIGIFMLVKLFVEGEKGCELANTQALNPIAEFFTFGENINRSLAGEKCSWGFTLK